MGPLAGQHDQLGLLVAKGQDLEAVGHDGQELDVVPLQEGDHLGDAARQPDGVLGSLLVQEQVVQRRDRVKQNALDRRRQELDQGGDAPGLEDGQQALSVVAEVVQGPDGALGRLEVAGVRQRLDQRGHHLGRVHQRVAGGLLLAQLMHHHGGLRDHDLIFVVQELDQLGNGSCREVGVVLVVDQVDDGVLQHLARLGQSLDGRRLRGVQLRRRDLDPVLERLGKHGGADALRSRLTELLVHLVDLLLGVSGLEGGGRWVHVVVNLLLILVVVAVGRGHGRHGWPRRFHDDSYHSLPSLL